MKITVNVDKNEIKELIKNYVKDNLNMDVRYVEITADGATVTSETIKSKPVVTEEPKKEEVKEVPEVKEVTPVTEVEKPEKENSITGILNTNNLFN